MEGAPCTETDRVNVAQNSLCTMLVNAEEKLRSYATLPRMGHPLHLIPRASPIIHGRLNVTDLGDSSLYIMRTQLTRQLQIGFRAFVRKLYI